MRKELSAFMKYKLTMQYKIFLLLVLTVLLLSLSPVHASGTDYEMEADLIVDGTASTLDEYYDGGVYAVRVEKDSTIVMDTLQNEDVKVKVKKGDILLIEGNLDRKGKTYVSVALGFITGKMERKNLEKTASGQILLSKKIPADYRQLTVKKSKYIYEKPDIKSRKIGVFRKETILASPREELKELSTTQFLPVVTPEGIGYVFAKGVLERTDGSY